MLPPEKAKAADRPCSSRSPTARSSRPRTPSAAAVAGNTRLLAIYALVASWICIIIYLWVRFQGVAFGLAAVIALIHDVFVMLGGHRHQHLHRPLSSAS